VRLGNVGHFSSAGEVDATIASGPAAREVAAVQSVRAKRATAVAGDDIA
jgi:hypothetical protein